MQIMDRRRFFLLWASAALASNSALAARKIPRVGFIGPGSADINQNFLEVFRDGLGALGWVEENDVVILDRWAEERTERLPRIARELVSSGVDVLVTAGTPATLAARSITTTIPIIMVGVGDPIGSGIVNALARPGGNTTGLSLSSPELIVQRLEVLREIVPGITRVAVMVRNDPGLEQRLLDVRTSAARVGMKTVEFVADTGRAVELAFMWLRSDRCDGLYVASGPLGPAKRAQIINLAAQAHIPAIYGFSVFPAAGGLMSLGADDEDLFRRAAIYVDRLLNGAHASDLPVEQPVKFRLVINLKTARTLGLAIPPPILARADAIVE